MSLENKGRGEEQIHANKDQQDFKLAAQRNKLLGLWLAEFFGLADAESYAKEVIMSDLDEPGDDDVVRKVMKDIATHAVNLSENDVRTKMKVLLAEVSAA
ncbi:MAG: DUF1476 domain-containing protein [Rhodospirillales bacterium]|jgi:hypothetical protein|nr:DUF1476 domain-containing protein [Rhodospirillales bacterium]